jgi:hypothetical protein
MDNTPQEGTFGENNGTAGESFAKRQTTPSMRFFVRGAQKGDNVIPLAVEGERLAMGVITNGRQSGHGIPSAGTPESKPFRAVRQASRVMPSSATIPQGPPNACILPTSWPWTTPSIAG